MLNTVYFAAYCLSKKDYFFLIPVKLADKLEVFVLVSRNWFFIKNSLSCIRKHPIHPEHQLMFRKEPSSCVKQ